MNESCAACKTDYEVTPQNAGLVMFLGYPPASHIVATCTHCQRVEVIYVSSTVLVKLAAEGEGQFPLTLRDQPTDDRRAAADAAWARVATSQLDADEDLVLDLPEAPRDWMRQLHDDLREFGRRS
jgi:hypothetical protein